MKGKNDPTTFLPLKSKSRRTVRYVKDMENMCSTADQAKYIYKNVKQDSIVNVETVKQDLVDDRLNKDNDEEEEENPYWNIIIMSFIGMILLYHKRKNGQYLATLLMMYNMIGILEIFII